MKVCRILTSFGVCVILRIKMINKLLLCAKIQIGCKKMVENINYNDKMVLFSFIKSNFPSVFLGNNDAQFMCKDYSTVFICSDEVLYNLNNGSLFKTFDAEELLSARYIKLKSSVIKKRKDAINYFEIYENTISILNKIKSKLENKKNLK